MFKDFYRNEDEDIRGSNGLFVEKGVVILGLESALGKG